MQMGKIIKITKFNQKYIDDLINIFRISIYETSSKDYTKEQIDAWVSSTDRDKWISMFNSHYSLIALSDGRPIGFSDITSDGYLNMLYVHPSYQRQGVATRLCDALEKHINKDITVDSSRTALNFFLKRGYVVIKEQTVYREGVAINNFHMVKNTVK